MVIYSPPSEGWIDAEGGKTGRVHRVFIYSENPPRLALLGTPPKEGNYQTFDRILIFSGDHRTP